MAVESGKPIAHTTMSASTDSTVTNSGASETREVYSLVFHDHGGSGANVEIFLSSDSTSAAAERIERITLAANETTAAKPVAVGQSQYLIAKPDAANINYHGAYTLRNGGDI